MPPSLTYEGGEGDVRGATYESDVRGGTVGYTVEVVERPLHGVWSAVAVIIVTICLFAAIIGLAAFIRYGCIHVCASAYRANSK